MSFKIHQLSAGSHRYQRYPRTGELKRAGPFMPHRPQKFESWMTAPLKSSAGRFRRLARELVKKPLRAQRMRAQINSGDRALAEKLGIGNA